MNDNQNPIVLLLADRSGGELGGLCRDTCVAMLPILGKPVIQHSLEWLARGGFREVVVAVSAFADQIEELVGGGERWGLQLQTRVTRGEQHPLEFLARHFAGVQRPLLLMRGDVLLDIDPQSVSGLLAEGDHPRRLSDGHLDLMLDLLPNAASAGPGMLDNLAWPPATSSLPDCVVEGARLFALDSPRGFHQASLFMAGGEARHLRADGRAMAPGLVCGIGARYSAASIRGRDVFIGRNCDVDASAELLDQVVLNSDVVVDRNATLHRAVVLPHSYIGDMVNVDNALVKGSLMIDLDSGNEISVVDRFLLSDMHEIRAASPLGDWLGRLLAGLILLVSLPLWPLAWILSRFESRGESMKEQPLCGNRRGTDGSTVFSAREWSTRIPVLRFLPRLFAVLGGHLRLVGVSALTPEQDRQRSEDWERVRDRAPVGLIGPAQLLLGADAPLEERLMADAWYVRERSLGRDMLWLLRGAALVLRARAWRRPPGAA